MWLEDTEGLNQAESVKIHKEADDDLKPGGSAGVEDSGRGCMLDSFVWCCG
jgi:hypothetical protein